MPTTAVLFDIQPGDQGDLGIITLNRPEALNSLNHEMISAMFTMLSRWQTDSSIKAVIVKAVPGRAFCAGGDIKLTYERRMKQDPDLTVFFREEYALNSLIYHYEKPYIALLDGITMGGGVGISIHGSHRIATKRLVFAMPETGIGFYPDVGGTYFLPRLKGYFGFYLGLTGARLSSVDASALNIATALVDVESLGPIIEKIRAAHLPANSSLAKKMVTDLLSEFQLEVSSTGSILAHQEQIDACFSRQTVGEIIESLAASEDILCSSAHEALVKKSPSSLKVSLAAFQRAKSMTFDQCMAQELVLTINFLKQHDFFEGIRALLIEKDQNPKWRPAQLNMVSEADVEAYFYDATEQHPQQNAL